MGGLQQRTGALPLIGATICGSAVLVAMPVPAAGTWTAPASPGLIASLLALLVLTGVAVGAVARLRRAREALAATERRFRQMAANVPGVIFQFFIRRDDSIWFSYLSEGCQALMGVEPGRFPWRADSLVERIHPDDMVALRETVRRSATGMEAWTWEGRITLGSGEIRWLRAASRPTRGPDGKITWDGLLMDVTDEKATVADRDAASAALRESEERFRQMAENMREVFFMVSVDGRELIYLSPSYETVWGRPRADTQSFIESVLPEDRPVLYADMALSRSGEGDPLRFIDYRISRPDGSIRWIRHRTVQILDDEGRPYRVAGVCSDMTEQKQLEEELRRANRIEAIGHLAAGIAHEINTPIQYIGDNIRFLDESFVDFRVALEAYETLTEEAEAGTLTPERLRELQMVVEGADLRYLLEEGPRASTQALEGVQRVAEIVRAMKEFSHPGSGQKVPTDLNQAIRSTTTVARNEWRYVADLVTELDASLPLVTCFPGELNQAILNLVVNAAHAIAERQQADGTEERGMILIRTCAVGDWIEIRVTDTGTGIPPEIQGRVFDPFFTTKEVGRGTGQGLTFVHSIVVDKHAGTVSFDTEPGVGTTFVLRLPTTGEARCREAEAA